MKDGKYDPTYDLIFRGKAEVMRKIFRYAPYEECAEEFSEEELVKCFDFFDRHSESDDDSTTDSDMWALFIKKSKLFLSEKSYEHLMEVRVD